MTQCLFCRIVEGVEKSWVFWEDANHVAFLTPFPNTPGASVVATRAHRTSDVLSLSDNEYSSFMLATREVDHLLRAKLGVQRCAVIIEGYGIDHAHSKLFPLHGIPSGAWVPIVSNQPTFAEYYRGFVTSQDGPRADDALLDELVRQIRS